MRTARIIPANPHFKYERIKLLFGELLTPPRSDLEIHLTI
jgi:hypothetical protein